ncbi:MAG: molybdopterin-dependent oxidoreductase [Chloroflexota bacterium]
MVVRGGCAHDCPDSCAWLVTVEEGRAVKLVGDPHHPYTRGGLCAKVNRYLDRVYSPDRVLHPLRRTGAKGEGRFEPVTWEVALAEIAGRLQGVIAAHGAEAVLPFSYAGNMGLVQYAGMDRRFFARMGASRLQRTICGDTANAGVEAVLGTPTGMLPEDIVHSRLIVLWGTNTVVTNVHLWPLVRQAREAGARVVVIDPVRTRTAEEADWHLRPLPGTDGALALGMIHVIAEAGLEDREYLERHCNGWEALRERVRDYPAERVATLTGLRAEDVVQLAREFATTRPACIRTLVGPEKHAHGGQTFRAIASLPCVTGAWRELGGGLLHWTRSLFSDSLNVRAVARSDIRGARTRSINMIQLGRALTDEALAPPIKALVVFDANPAAILPNSNLVRTGLEREDLFTVVSDLFLTDTARHADYVLPATSFIEHWDVLFPWGQTYAVLNRPAVEPVGESISNGELFRRLAAAMGYDDPHLQDSDEEMVRAALRTDHPYMQGIDAERLLAEGWAPLNLPRPWLPFAEGGFPTESGRAELWTEDYLAPPSEDDWPLVLVSAKTALHFLNSSYSNLPRHARHEELCVDLADDDAAARGVADGEVVRIHNSRGELRLVARVRDRVRPGVVAIPHGFWGASANVLTGDGIADLGGGGDFYGTRVEVSRA